ncbi:MAG: site-specific integrase [Proteobacteria bacterium]|nr:site-specific integrase [Pseudomonadota bacterium]
MSYKLLPPGTRHGNKVYYAVVTAKGKRVEVSTDTTDKRLARKYAQQVESELFERHVLDGSEGTVSAAIDSYIAFRRPRKVEEGYLLKIRGLIGKRRRHGIGQEDFDECAQVLYPTCANETWNRCVYTPLQAALRHVGLNLRIRRPKQKKPMHKSLTAAQRDLLIKNADDPELRALLTLLFYAGPRISEAINLTRDDTDLQKGVARFVLTKTGEEHWRPLHEKVVVALANLPVRQDGRFFRWKTRFGPRKPIADLCKKTGIPFHPHLARHTFADLFLEKGGSLRDLMDAGGWQDEKSAMRYTARNVERVRKAVNNL